MRKNLKIISMIVMMFFLIFFNNSVFADDKTHELIIDDNGIKYSNVDNMFINLEEMIPGDSKSKLLTIENIGTKPQQVFMRVEKLSEEADTDLLSKIKLEVNYNNKTIYKGRACGSDGLGDNINSGTIAPKKSYTIEVNVTLDGMSTENEYQDTKGQVKWIFTTMADNTNSSLNDDNLGDDNIKPPQTGDNGIYVYILLFVTCIVLLYLHKRNLDKNNAS